MTIRIAIAVSGPRGAAGAWLLDLPGCHSPGEDETLALVGVPAALRRYADVRERHRVGGPAKPAGPVEVAERLEIAWHGWQPLDTAFSTDRGPATVDDVEFTATMIAATRRELLAAAQRAGPGREGDRSVDEMLHHVAGAEWWYATRLEEDPSRLRAEGRADLKDPPERLAAVREWALRRIRALPSLGDLDRVYRGDDWSERWTPKKVLRRYIYHELDHLAELEARARP